MFKNCSLKKILLNMTNRAQTFTKLPSNPEQPIHSCKYSLIICARRSPKYLDNARNTHNRNSIKHAQDEARTYEQQLLDQ